jgi:hypothetical protein
MARWHAPSHRRFLPARAGGRPASALEARRSAAIGSKAAFLAVWEQKWRPDLCLGYMTARGGRAYAQPW